jgi:hypothetical protein
MITNKKSTLIYLFKQLGSIIDCIWHEYNCSCLQIAISKHHRISCISITFSNIQNKLKPNKHPQKHHDGASYFF